MKIAVIQKVSFKVASERTCERDFRLKSVIKMMAIIQKSTVNLKVTMISASVLESPSKGVVNGMISLITGA